MATDSSSSTFLHPASGSLIMVLDWVLFSGNMLALGLGTPMLATLGFVLGTLSVGLVQHRYGHESTGKSILKGLLGGLTVGIPFPIAGTAVGGFVIALSGLNRWRDRLTSRRDRSHSDEKTLQR